MGARAATSSRATVKKAMLANVHKTDPVLVQPAYQAPHNNHGSVHGLLARGVQPVSANGPGTGSPVH
eukprot:7058445-Lingulodinium_polyedra.AAC.1